METYRQDLFEEFIGYKVNFVQDNESKSTKGVLRGLHYQLPPHDQAKLIRVVHGAVLDVAVDVRKFSPYFGQHVSVILSSDNKRQLFIPRGFAHGFLVMSDTAIFSYKVDNCYAPQYERGIIFNDRSLSINWQLPQNIIKLSDKDKLLPSLSNINDFFEK